MKTAFVFGLLIVSIACMAISGSGNIVKEFREVSDFTGVSLHFSGDVTITQSKTYSCEISAEDNLMEYIVTEVDNGTLRIRFQEQVNIRSHKNIHIDLSMPVIENIAIHGSGDIDSNGSLKGKDLSVAIRGSGDCSLVAEYENTNVSIDGSGDCHLKGQTGSLQVAVNGSGDVQAFDMLASSCAVHINGSGDVNVMVDSALSAAINGSGDVKYIGSPSSVSRSVHGSGDIIQVSKEVMN